MRLGFSYPLWLLYILHVDSALCLPRDTRHPSLWTWGKHVWFVTLCLTNIAGFLFFFVSLLFSVLCVSTCRCMQAAQNHGGVSINYAALLVILLIIYLIEDDNRPYYPRTQYLGTSSSMHWFMVSFLFYNCWTYNDACDQVLCKGTTLGLGLVTWVGSHLRATVSPIAFPLVFLPSLLCHTMWAYKSNIGLCGNICQVPWERCLVYLVV